MAPQSLQNSAFRFALYMESGKACSWCFHPISYAEMEIDHLIPKTADAEKIAKLVALHGLVADFSVDETYNLTPSCQPCNTRKGARLPEDAPVVTQLFRQAADRAAKVERSAEARKKAMSAPIGRILASVDNYRDDPDSINVLLDHLKKIGVLERPVPDNQDVSFMILPGIQISVADDEASYSLKFGDCPNHNCLSGEVSWRIWPQEDGSEPLRAGTCDSCGAWAVSCGDTECSTVTGVYMAEQSCDGCDKRYGVYEHPDGDHDVVELPS